MSERTNEQTKASSSIDRDLPTFPAVAVFAAVIYLHL